MGKALIVGCGKQGGDIKSLSREVTLPNLQDYSGSFVMNRLEGVEEEVEVICKETLSTV